MKSVRLSFFCSELYKTFSHKMRLETQYISLRQSLTPTLLEGILLREQYALIRSCYNRLYIR